MRPAGASIAASGLPRRFPGASAGNGRRPRGGGRSRRARGARTARRARPAPAAATSEAAPDQRRDSARARPRRRRRPRAERHVGSEAAPAGGRAEPLRRVVHGCSASRKLSKRFSPMPSTSRSSPIERKPPCSVRYSTIRCASVGPMPSIWSSCSTVTAPEAQPSARRAAPGGAVPVAAAGALLAPRRRPAASAPAPAARPRAAPPGSRRTGRAWRGVPPARCTAVGHARARGQLQQPRPPDGSSHVYVDRRRSVGARARATPAPGSGRSAPRLRAAIGSGTGETHQANTASTAATTQIAAFRGTPARVHGAKLGSADRPVGEPRNKMATRAKRPPGKNGEAAARGGGAGPYAPPPTAPRTRSAPRAARRSPSTRSTYAPRGPR